MNDSTHANAALIYALPEESFQTLQELRNLLFLMASTTYASTVEEEKVLLHLPRSMLAQCFQIFGTQLADVLDAVKLGHINDRPQQTH
jgi:hypothetical protein